MKKLYILLVLLVSCCATIYAQEVKVHGVISSKSKPMQGVLIVIFENDSFYKKFITDGKGKYRFKVDNKTYNIFYYRPGYKPEQARIINNLDEHTQSIPIDMEMVESQDPPDSILAHSGVLDRLDPAMARSYITYIYEYERRHAAPLRDTTHHTTRNVLLKRALDERARFANYKQKATVKEDKEGKIRVVSTTIGIDHYEQITSAKGERKYYKNDKPITPATYRFETTRRYEGVLKNKRDVKKFEKYDPGAKSKQIVRLIKILP